MRDIKIVEIPSELGAGTRGSSLGIASIKIAALDFMSNFFIQFPTERVEAENELLFEPITTPFAKRIGGVVSMAGKISKTVQTTIQEGFFPIIISGDHSNAIGTIAGIKTAYPQGKLGIVWIDAHADLHTPYTTPSGNVHGMPLSASLNEDNLECKTHDVDEKTITQWNLLKTIHKTAPKIDGEDIVFISLRESEKEEKFLIRKYGMKVIPTSEVRKKGIEAIAKNTLKYLKDCSQIYISFDVDSIDPSISRGTGTPVRNGLLEREAYDLVSKLMQSRAVCCFELTEVNPTLDKENMMSEIGFNILQRCTNVIMMNQ